MYVAFLFLGLIGACVFIYGFGAFVVRFEVLME